MPIITASPHTKIPSKVSHGVTPKAFLFFEVSKKPLRKTKKFMIAKIIINFP